MAIKISGNTVIDDSQNITATGSATISGRMLLGTTTEGQQNADNLTIADSGHCGLTIRSGTTSGGAIYFSDATSGGGEYEGYIEYNHPSRFMRFGTAQDEAMRLDSSGNLNIGGTLPSAPNISLNADGSATFTSTNPVVTDQPSSGNSANPAIQIKHDGTINGSWRHDGRLEVGGQDANAVITLSPDGSATFGGVVTGTADYNTFTASVTLANEGTSFRSTESSAGSASKYHFFGSANGTNFCNIATDGSATFAGGGAVINSYGQLVITRSDSNAYPSLTINSAGTTTNTIDLNGDGSATFGAFNTSSTTTHGVTIDQYVNSHSGVRVQSTDAATTVGEFFAAYRGSSAVFQVLTGGNATLAGTITANGGYALSQLTELT